MRLTSPTVLPWLRRTSASLSFPMICSAINPFSFILTPILILNPILTHPLDRFSGGWSIMAITGHKTMAMFKRYNRVDLGDGIEAIKKLDQYLSREPEKREVRKEERQEEKADYFTTLLHMSRSGHLPPPNLLKSWWRCRDLAGL